MMQLELIYNWPLLILAEISHVMLHLFAFNIYSKYHSHITESLQQ